jgi:divalent metal cation (Fe/Co/Zn/Cd) transporter
VAVLLFGVAGWKSLTHGYDAIRHGVHRASDPVTVLGVTFDPIWVNVVVLLGAIGFETYALAKANAELRRQIDEYGWSGLVEAFRITSDTVTLTAFTEDAIALAGAAIALVGVVLTRVTGNHLYDAASAAVIGLLLMGFALALAWQNKRLLLGESAPKSVEDRLRTAALDRPEVRHVDALRTMYVGPENLLVTLEVSFAPGFQTDALDQSIGDIEAALREVDGRVGDVYVEPEV